MIQELLSSVSGEDVLVLAVILIAFFVGGSAWIFKLWLDGRAYERSRELGAALGSAEESFPCLYCGKTYYVISEKDGKRVLYPCCEETKEFGKSLDMEIRNAAQDCS